jgi:hypothetical protein
MTITEFLVCVGLDPNIPYFKQLCSKTTRRLHPSKRRNSPGLEFREAVSNILPIFLPTQPAAYLMDKLLETVISELHGLGISGIYLSKFNSMLTRIAPLLTQKFFTC